MEEFAAVVKERAAAYRTNHVMIPMGGDFTYQAAEIYYANIDKLVSGFRKYKPEINVIYSTPSCYINAVHEEVVNGDINLELKTDDFFPYASDAHSVWSGYYTSRPNSKRNERMANNLLQVRFLLP